MTPSDDNVRAILRVLSAPQREAAERDAGWRRILEQALDEARAAWPEIRCTPENFLPSLALRLRPEGELGAQLASLRIPHLFLAWACAQRDSAALRAFEKICFPEISGVMPRNAGFEADDVAQQARAKLFVPQGKGHAKVLEYAGRGELKAWFRVLAARIAVDLARAGAKEEPAGELGDLPEGATGDPELEHFRKEYAEDFRRAFADAAQQLTARERNLLRQHVLDGLTFEELSRIHHVHRITIARWISSARGALREATRALLSERLELTPSQLESVLRLLPSQLELSLRRVLDDAPTPRRH